MTDAARGSAVRFGPPWPLRSLLVRLVALVLIFLAVPVPIYQQFHEADQERQELLLEGAELHGTLIARALAPLLENARSSVPPNLTEVLGRLAEDDVRVKLLLRPVNVPRAHGFFFVAATPPVPSAVLDQEREELIQLGVLGRLEQVCRGNEPLALRISTDDGGQEVLTSITPINTALGCWALITAQASPAYLSSSLGQPYWNTSEVRAAAIIYVGMAVLVLMFFVGIWRNLRRFGRLAREIGFDSAKTRSFAVQNRIPELQSVAQDFDRLVETLRNSAENIRRAAEDNAHAFKTPIGVIRQSVEPLRRIAGSDRRAAEAIWLIEEALFRLDTLVTCARHMDQTTADLFEPPSSDVDLAGLLDRMLRGYAEACRQRDLRLDLNLGGRPKVRASEELLETAVENVIDNALRFSPPGSAIEVALRKAGRHAELTVADQGPGVDPVNLDRIFERYFSERRPEDGNGPDGSDGSDAGEPHFGIGLWIVRQNVQSMGGEVRAENRPTGGLCVRIFLPRSR